jgi:hypothetical protein
LEKAVCVLLEHLGKIRHPYLTPLEEQLLRFLEQEFGVFHQNAQFPIHINVNEEKINARY